MKKISFAYLENYEKILLKSIIKLLDKTKQFVVIENHEDDKNVDVIFINYNDKKAQELINKTDKTCEFILITSSNRALLDENENSSTSVLSRPLNVQKISSILSKFKDNGWYGNGERKTSLSEEVFKLDLNKNFVIHHEQEICLVLNDKKEVYHNLKDIKLDDWIKNPSLMVKETTCDSLEAIEKYGLNQTFIYDCVYYLLHYEVNYKFINEDSHLILKKFPNIFPQVHLYQDKYRDFYHLYCYLSKKQRSIKELCTNLNIPLESILKCANALYKLGYLTIAEPIEITEPKVTKVKSIFSKIKSVLGMQ